MRDLVFVDVETTGLEPGYHEIIEVAATRVDPRTLAVCNRFESKIHPEHPDRADPEALRTNGYTPEAWAHALPLGLVLDRLTPVLDGGVLAGHNVAFDRDFLFAGYRQTERRRPDLDYLLVDTVALAWPLVTAGLIEAPKLRLVCEHLGIDNDGAHSAAADVRRTIEVYRRLMPVLDPATFARWSAMEADERAVVRTIVERMHAGRGEYGPWRTDDGRNYPSEALFEVMDALNYCAAELVRLGRQR